MPSCRFYKCLAGHGCFWPAVCIGTCHGTMHCPQVLLVVPWLEPEEQELLYPKGMVFKTKEEQAEYILSEGRKRTSLPCKFTVLFWDGK